MQSDLFGAFFVVFVGQVFDKSDLFFQWFLYGKLDTEHHP